MITYSFLPTIIKKENWNKLNETSKSHMLKHIEEMSELSSMRSSDNHGYNFEAIYGKSNKSSI